MDALSTQRSVEVVHRSEFRSRRDALMTKSQRAKGIAKKEAPFIAGDNTNLPSNLKVTKGRQVSTMTLLLRFLVMLVLNTVTINAFVIRGSRFTQPRTHELKIQATKSVVLHIPRKGKGLLPAVHQFNASSTDEIHTTLLSIPSCAKFFHEMYELCNASHPMSDADLSSTFESPSCSEISLTVKSKAKSFSHFKYRNLEEAYRYAKVDNAYEEDLTGLPMFNISEKAARRVGQMSEVIDSIMVQARLIGEYTRRDAYAEMVSRALINPVLYGALAVHNNSDVKIDMEVMIKGSMAYGPLDYCVAVKNYNIAVEEAKAPESQLWHGLAQLVAQIIACREQFCWSREMLEDREGIYSYLLDEIPSFGIISTGKLWRIAQYRITKTGQWQLLLGKPMSLSTRASEDVLREEVTNLLIKIATVLEIQTLAVDKYFNTFRSCVTQSGTTQPTGPPSARPTTQPSGQPSSQPSAAPSTQPSGQLSVQP